jgi:hypothetical protein
MFRDRLIALETQINGIVPGDAAMWKGTWPLIKARMSDLRIEAVRISNLADDVHGSLIRELQSAAK